ncbi:MAG: hypothetical protein RLZ14_2004 [Actinomycetota bacterium]
MTDLGCFAAGGVAFTLSAPEPFAAVLAESLADLRVASAPSGSVALSVAANPDGTFDLRRGTVPGGTALEPSRALHAALSMVNETIAEGWSARHSAIHAAVVDRGGAGVALIGYSGFGKTTLAAAAVQAGWGFVSDELGLVDQQHVAHAFHRPLGLRRGGLLHLRLEAPTDPLFEVVRPCRGSSLGALSASTSLRCLVFMGAPSATGEITAVSPGSALARLLSNVHGAAGVERDVFRRLERLVRAVPAVQLPRQGLDTMVALLDELLSVGAAQAAAPR